MEDDCSPEPLEALVRALVPDRIAYQRQPRNLGTYATQNAALARARGIWTHVLNDDDRVEPGFYERFHAALSTLPDRVGAACCASRTLDAAGTTTGTSLPLRHGAGVLPDWLRTIGSANPLHPVAVVVRRSEHEHLGGYQPELTYCGDWEFYKRAASMYEFWYEPEPLACYREYEGNVSSGGLADGAQLCDIARAIELSKTYLPADTRELISAAAGRTYAAHALRLAAHFLQSGQLAAALTVTNEGLALSRSPDTLALLVQLLALPEAAPWRATLPAWFQALRTAGHSDPSGQ